MTAAHYLAMLGVVAVACVAYAAGWVRAWFVIRRRYPWLEDRGQRWQEER